MFSWVCPRCGRENSPSYTECPDCRERDLQEQAEAGLPPSPVPIEQYQSPAQTQEWQAPYQPPQTQAPPPVYAAPPPQQPQYVPPPPQYAQPPQQQAPQYVLPYAPPQYAQPQQYAPPQQAPYAPPQPQYNQTQPVYVQQPPPQQQYAPPSPPPQFAAPPQQYTPPPAPVTPPKPKPAYVPPKSTPVPPEPSSPGLGAKLSALPTPILMLLFAVLFLLVGAGVYYGYQRFGKGGDSTAASGEKTSAAPKQPKVTNPIQKYVEVVGIRLTTDAKKKPIAKFLIVSHASTELTNLGGNVTLWASTSRSEEDSVGSFAFAGENLGPYQSKEVTAPFTTKLKMYELPDWQNATPELQITSPQQ